MSNRTDGRKLRLRSERLRQLTEVSPQALGEVAGGTIVVGSQGEGRIGSRACVNG